MSPTSLYSPQAPKGWLPWGALAPFLCILLVALPLLAGQGLLEHFQLVDAKGEPRNLLGLGLFLLLPFALMGLVFLGWVRYVERRPVATLGLVGGGGLKAFLRGHAVGLATLAAVVAAIWATGGFQAGGYGRAFASPRALLGIGFLLPCFALQSSVEELVFRGWLLSGVARKFNVLAAVLLTSAVFAFLHYAPRQPWAVVLGTFLFSVFACAWALRTGHIWGVMGWHAGWNWLLAVGFEVPVTGLNAGLPALLVQLKPRGSTLLNGGTQGPEGSLWCSLFFAAGIAYHLWRARKPRPLAPQEVP